MDAGERLLLTGDEAVGLAAIHCRVFLGTGYPGTPSTEILEYFSHLGGKAQWAPNEKVALEVGIGVAFSGARSLVTMKHVGLNVASDPLFSVAYTGVDGGLVVVSADDPGMASSQNEQDNRRYAVAAGVPMFEPSDAQEAYDFTIAAYELSEKYKIPVLLRMTTRVCHSRTAVVPRKINLSVTEPSYNKSAETKVLIPAYARAAHKRLRKKLSELKDWSENSAYNYSIMKDRTIGIITSGISYVHSVEAAPDVSILKLGFTYPLPMNKIAEFVKSVKRCVVVEEGDPYLYETIRAAGIPVEGKSESFRFGELNVQRVRQIIFGGEEVERKIPSGKAPQLCDGCQYRVVYDILHKFGCIVAGDIGCYTLGVLPPFNAMDTCLCMGASIGVGLGLRHALPPEQARKVVSVIGDSTFIHSGITGLVEMVYNPPPTGHVVIILDNQTTAMTGLQEHPGTGRKLNHEPTNQVVLEEVVKGVGVKNLYIVEPRVGSDSFEKVLTEALNRDALTVIIARRPCLLASKKLKEFERCEEKQELSSNKEKKQCQAK
ncbi:MAG: thiamine pyrophosphate-dependent enzyme [Verrucomicrobiia bacterium]